MGSIKRIESIMQGRLTYGPFNDHTNFALEGEGEHSAEDDAYEKDLEDNGEEEGEDEIAWEDQMGPEGRTKLDEYYDARKAKNKKQTQTPKKTDWKYIG